MEREHSRTKVQAVVRNVVLVLTLGQVPLAVVLVETDRFQQPEHLVVRLVVAVNTRRTTRVVRPVRMANMPIMRIQVVRHVRRVTTVKTV